jgi:hypothetical protein
MTLTVLFSQRHLVRGFSFGTIHKRAWKAVFDTRIGESAVLVVIRRTSNAGHAGGGTPSWQPTGVVISAGRCGH